MTVTDIYGDTQDGNVYGNNATYATARSTYTASAGGTSLYCGQRYLGGTYGFYEALLAFDTSSIEDTDVVTDVTLSLFCDVDNGGEDFEVYDHQWTTPYGSNDFVAGDDIGDLTLVATYAGSPSGDYSYFTQESAFTTVTGIKTGWVRLLVVTARQRTGNTPTGNEYVTWFSTEFDAQIECLTITHEAGGGPVAGTATADLGGLTATAVGVRTVAGTATADLGGLTATASGVRTVAGAAVADLGALSATAVGGQPSGPVFGTATADLGGLTATATGVRTVAGAATADLGGLSAQAAGVRTVAGAATADLGGLTATASGVRTVAGAATADLGGLTATAAGQRTTAGTATADLGGLTAQAAGVRTVAGTATADLGGLTATASGGQPSGPVFGTATADLGGLSATAVGVRTVAGTATADLGGLTATATGTIGYRGQDLVVTPIVAALFDLLTTEFGLLDASNGIEPRPVHIRPGDQVEFLVSTASDECCTGLVWVRAGPVVPSAHGSFPEQDGDVWACDILRYAVTCEIGAARCAPTSSADALPTPEEWAQVSLAVLEDGAALRRTVCRLVASDDFADVLISQGAQTPLSVEGGCVGVTLELVVAADACDCQQLV